jgi:hypothetical protein
LQDRIKTEIARALGKMIGKPVKEVETTGEGLETNDFPIELTAKTLSEHGEAMNQNTMPVDP